MSFYSIIIFNFILFIINLYILWKLIQFKNYLSHLNRWLYNINDNLTLLLKEIPLAILLAGLEIRKVKNNYILLGQKINTTKKTIVITQFIYRIMMKKSALI